MGTNKGKNRMLLGFSGATASTPVFSYHKKLYRSFLPTSKQDVSRAAQCQQEQITLAGACRNFSESQVVAKKYPRLGYGILTISPFPQSANCAVCKGPLSVRVD